MIRPRVGSWPYPQTLDYAGNTWALVSYVTSSRALLETPLLVERFHNSGEVNTKFPTIILNAEVP
jgi:hypothetical protein